MTTKGIVVELMVNNMEETIQFYEEILGFQTLIKEEREGLLEWAKLELQGFQVSFKPEAKMKEEVAFMKNKDIGGTLSVCIGVGDLTAYYEIIEDKFRVLNYPHLTPCGSTQFSMLDPNGSLRTNPEYSQK